MKPTPEQVAMSPYHYIPTEWVCIVFVALFGLSTLLHLGQALYCKMWWLLFTAVLCGIGEIIGWSARLSSSIDIVPFNPFLIQISTTIISPTFLVAANFIILGRVIRALGEQYSRLTPRAYSIVFVSADVVALTIQAVGGGLASSAADPAGAEQGAKVMLGGILLQFVAIIIYTTLASEFLVRYFAEWPLRKNGQRGMLDTRLRLMVIGLCISTFFLLIRTIYRTIELQDGWTGSIISNEKLFNTLDGMPITVAMFTLNVLHPGWLLYDRAVEYRVSALEEKLMASRSLRSSQE